MINFWGIDRHGFLLPSPNLRHTAKNDGVISHHHDVGNEKKLCLELFYLVVVQIFCQMHFPKCFSSKDFYFIYKDLN